MMVFELCDLRLEPQCQCNLIVTVQEALAADGSMSNGAMRPAVVADFAFLYGADLIIAGSRGHGAAPFVSSVARDVLAVSASPRRA